MVAEGVKTSRGGRRAGRAVRRRDADRRGGLRASSTRAGRRPTPTGACCAAATCPRCTAWARAPWRALRTWLLRRVMGRLRITDDIVRHLSTFQRLGEDAEVEVPDRAACRSAPAPCSGALRTRAAAQVGADWVWPYWLERQLDPASPAFVPARPPAVPHQPHAPQLDRWSATSTRPWEAIVDPRGLVTPWVDGWSLDWWIGADDRWHLPSREAGRAPAPRRRRRRWSRPRCGSRRRRRRSASTPCGAAAPRAAASWSSSRSRTASPRPGRRWPWPSGRTTPRAWRSSSASTCTGTHGHRRRPGGAAAAPRRRARVAASTFHDGDSAAAVLGRRRRRAAGGPRCATRPGWPRRRSCSRWPTAPRSGSPSRSSPAPRTPPPAAADRRLVAAPAFPDGAAAGRGGGRRVAGAEPTGACGSCCPTSGWPRRSTPTAGSCCCSTTATRSRPGPATYHRFWFRDAAYLLGALDRYGFHDEVGPGAAPRTRAGQRRDGFFFSQRQEWDANGAALVALAEHWRLARDRALRRGDRRADRPGRALDRPQAALAGGRTPRRRRAAGLLPAGHVGRAPRSVRLLLLGRLLGRRRAARRRPTLLRRGRPARRGRRRRGGSPPRMWADVEASLARDRRAPRHRRHPGRPAPPHRRRRDRLAGRLLRRSGCCAADDPRIAATADAVRDALHVPTATRSSRAISHTGLGTYLTLQLAVGRAARPATAAASTGWPGCSTPPPRRGPGPRRSTRGSGAGAWATATTGGPRPTCSRSCATCSCARSARRRPRRRWPGVARARRLVRPGRGRCTTRRPPTAASPTPCAGTATGWRCCGSSTPTPACRPCG